MYNFVYYFLFTVSVESFVTEGKTTRRVDLSEKIHITCYCLENQPVQQDSPKKKVCIVLDRLTANEIDMACNPSKYVIRTKTISSNVKVSVNANQQRCLRSLKFRGDTQSNQHVLPAKRTSGEKVDPGRFDSPQKTVAINEFKINDVVWCKLKGHPKWPAIVKKIYGKSNQMIQLYWFNDYRMSAVHRAQVSKFTTEPFNTENGKLVTAIKEAVLYIRSKQVAAHFG